MSALVTLDNVTFSRGDKNILSGVSWVVKPGELWVVLGPNASGKTTLLELVADWETPTAGSVEVLGDDTQSEESGWIRPRVGIASAGMNKRIPPRESVRDSIVSAAYAVASSEGEIFDDEDVQRGERVAREWGLAELLDVPLEALSEGELKKTQIARATMTDPELLLLDEPTAGLDLGAREELLSIINLFAQTPGAPTIILVTHHVEEIPLGFTHALVLSGGTVASAGPIESTVTSEVLSSAFGRPIAVSRVNGRLTAQAGTAV